MEVRRIIWLVGLVFWLLPCAGTGATPNPILDSLRHRLAAAPPDTHRVLLLDELCWTLSQTDLPAAHRYGEEGLRLARRLGYRRGQARCLNDLGHAATLAGDLPAATRYYQQALPLMRALRRPRGEVNVLNGLGNVALQEQDFAAATRYYRQALAGARQLADSATLALTLANLGNVLTQQQQDDPAQTITAEALRLFRALGDSLGEATALNILGQVASHRRQYAAADTLLRAALALHQATGADFQRLSTLQNLGWEVFDAGRPGEALRVAQEALALAERIGALPNAVWATELAARATEALGQPAQSVSYWRRYIDLHDSVLSQEKQRELARLRVRFGVAEQQQRIRVLRLEADRQQARTRLLATTTAGLILVLALVTVFVVQLRRSRARLASSEGALRQANATKDRLMGIIGHDLRAPLVTFQQLGPLFAELADQPDPAEQHQLATTLTERARAVGGLVDNLLAWSRAQTGQVRPFPRPVRPAVLLTGLQTLLAPEAAVKGIALRVSCAPDVPDPVLTDPDLLTTVLRNLVQNALKFTPAGGTVTLAAEAAGPALRLLVADTGVGMAPAMLAAALAGGGLPSTPGTAGERGTGLGLSVVREFAALLGARWEGEALPGHGTRWTLTLPAGERETLIFAPDDHQSLPRPS